MLQRQADGLRLAARNDPKRHAEEIDHRQVERHGNATHAPAYQDTLAMKLDFPHAAVRAGIAGTKAQRKGKGVEPDDAARPGGHRPAAFRLTPQNVSPPPGFLLARSCSRLTQKLGNPLKNP